MTTLAFASTQSLFNAPANELRGDVRTADASLIDAIRRGSQSACEQLVREHGPRMLAVAKRFMRCEQDAADALQDAFICAFGGLHTFRSDARLSTWLHRVVVNACLMKIRSRSRDRAMTDSLGPDLGDDRLDPRARRDLPDAGQQLVTSETRRLVRECIERLPEPYRVVLLLRDIEELDTQATADLLGCSVANVKTRLHRARHALREALMRDVPGL